GPAAAAGLGGVPRWHPGPKRPPLRGPPRGFCFHLRPYVDALHGFRSRTWTVDELVLVRSRLPRSGMPGEQPRYEAVARRALGAAG
ncbi:RNA 2',3'-cyclic phosphodiesterase, partial [Streptomyces sp. NPDC055642]